MDKHCPKCGLVKPIKQFRKDKQQKDGRRKYCSLCERLKIPYPPYVPPTEKACTKCGIVKALVEFHHTKAHKDGHASACKECIHISTMAAYAKDPEKHIQKWRTYRATNPEVGKSARRKWQRANPDKKAASDARYRLGHKESIFKKTHAWYLQNAERIKEERRLERLENLEKFRAYDKNRYTNNPKRHAQTLEATRKRRARKKRSATNDFTDAEWQEMKAHYGHRCVYCGRKLQRLTQDHLTPLHLGGAHTKQNIVPACQSCNSKKYLGPPLVPVQPLLL